jgi:hypothetical protein
MIETPSFGRCVVFQIGYFDRALGVFLRAPFAVFGAALHGVDAQPKPPSAPNCVDELRTAEFGSLLPGRLCPTP